MNKPITDALLLIHEVLSQVSKDTGQNGLAIAHLCSALAVVIEEMNDGEAKSKAVAHLDTARTHLVREQ